MASFRAAREILLESFDDGEISEDEFLVLYDVNTSKNPDFRMNAMASSTLMRWTKANAWPNSGF